MRSGRVLVAVDDPARRERCAELLQRAGLDVVRPSLAGADVSGPLDPDAPDVVVLGPAVLSELPARWQELTAARPVLPAVVIASLDDAELIAGLLGSRIGAWLAPEASDDEIVGSVLSALARARRLREQDRLLDENLSYLATLGLYERAVSLLAIGSLEPLCDRLVEALCLETRAQSGVLWVARDDDLDRLRLAAMRGIVRASDEAEEIALDDLPREVRRLAEVEDRCLVAGRDAERLWLALRVAGRIVALARLGEPLRERGFAEADRASAERLGLLVAPGLARAVRLRGVERGALRDPDFGTYSLAVLEDAARREIDRAARFGRPVSLVELRIDARDGRRGTGASPDEVARRIGRCLRASDLLASDGRGRFRVLLPETDSLGAAVLKRRAEELVVDLLAGGPSRGASDAVAIAAATHPSDGRTLEALDVALGARIAESRASLLRSLAGARGALTEVLAQLAGHAGPVPAELPEQLACFALAEVARRPEERGLLFVATGSGLSLPVQDAIERLRGVSLRTDVVVLCDPWPETLSGCAITRVSPRRFGSRHPFLVRFGEGPSFALVRGSEETQAFQTSDRPLVEHLAFRLQLELAAAGAA